MRIPHPDRRQKILFPQSLDDFVEPQHRVRVIVEVVSQLDLSAFSVGIEETGRPAYPPEPLISLLFYAFSIGVFSAREMERRCQTDCAFMYATAGLRPSYRSISRFRAQYQEELAELFSQVVMICKRAGLGSTRIVVIDGTKQKANASIDAHIREEHLEKELKKIRRDMRKLLQEAARVDAEEDEDPAAQQGDEIPKELADKEARKKAIQEAIEGLQKEGDKEANRTDSQARLQRFKEGSRPGYNAQVAVSGEDGLILASEVVREAGDTEQLVPMVEEVERNTGENAGVIVADSGYESGENFQALSERGQDAVVSSAGAKAAQKRKRETGRYQWMDFRYDAEREEYKCPSGERMVLVRRTTQNGKPASLYEGERCMECKQKGKCTPGRVRRLSVLDTARYQIAMSERRRRDREGEQYLLKRKSYVEGHFAHMKHNLRWRHFMRRGLAACRSEFRMFCSALNLAKLARRLEERKLAPCQMAGI